MYADEKRPSESHCAAEARRGYDRYTLVRDRKRLVTGLTNVGGRQAYERENSEGQAARKRAS